MFKEIVENANLYLQKFAVGIVILLAGFALGLLVKKLLKKFLSEINLNNIMGKAGITLDLEKWVSSVLSYVIYFLTIIVFLDNFSIRSIVLYLAAGAVLMLVILTFLVGLKDVIPNFVAWLFLQRSESIKPGKKVEVKEIAGVVEKVGWRETEIKTEAGDVLYVPNALFMKSKFKVKKSE